MNIDIIVVGSIKEKYYTDAIKEYQKRLRPYANVEIIEVDEYKIPNNASDQEIKIGMDKEMESILSKVKDKAYLISLAIEGKQISSEDFADKIMDLQVNGYPDVAFIIGGSYGMSEEIKRKSDMKLSFSKMTYPHQLMRVILLEQIYRAFRIIRNEPYHK